MLRGGFFDLTISYVASYHFGSGFIRGHTGLVEGTRHYEMEMSIVAIISEDPGLTADKILNKLNEQERKQPTPALLPTLAGVEIILEELADADYIELKEGKAYPKMSSESKD